MTRFLFNCEKSNEQYIYEDFQSYFNTSYKINDTLNINIGHHPYCKEAIIEEIDNIVGVVQREWFLFQSIAIYDLVLPCEEVVNARELINRSFVGIKESLQICGCPLRKKRYKKKVFEELKCLINSIVYVNNMQDDFIVKLTSWKENDEKNPIYQYFHTFLEMQYYLILLGYVCEIPNIDVEEIIEIIMVNFIQLSKKNYQRHTDKVFVCSCMKNFWLLLQFYLEKKNFDFWEMFNKKLFEEDPMFSLWILTKVAELQMINESLENEGNICNRIKSNYDLLHDKLKIILLKADSDVLQLFKVINPLLTNYWLRHARVEVYQLVWEFYSKRLNLSTKNYSSLTALDLSSTLENIITSPDMCTEDFETFLGILICHLKEHPNHWSKIKGRIYSQLGPHKLKELNNEGIVRVMILFSSLSSLHYEELIKKLMTFLEGLSHDKRNNILIWNMYTAFIYKQVKCGLTLEKTAPLLLSWIQDASLDHKNFHLIKTFIINFENILNFSLHMDLQQWLFINSWLTKYLSSCYHADMTAALEVFWVTLKKVESPNYWSFWMQSFRDYIYPVLKQLSYTQNAPRTIGKIAGKLYFLIPQLSIDIFNYFTGDNMNSQIVLNLLTTVLDDSSSTCILNSQQEGCVMQCWIKICLLSKDPCKDLTKIVTKLDYFPDYLKSHVHNSDDPILALIEYLGSDIKVHVQSSNINKLCELCFGNIDKWLPQYLAHPDNESIVYRIYMCLSMAFLYCGPLLYSRNRSSSPLTKLIQCLLFSSNFLKGKAPHEYVLNSVKKTWHIFYEALVKLKTDSDMFLERSLKDMITKYMPHFSTNESSVIKCLENEITVEVVLEKISTSYFKHPVKESDNNLVKITKILSDIVQSTTSVSFLRLLITKTMCGLCELVIFHSQRNLAINLFKIITQSSLYSQVRSEFCDCIVTTTERHLGFNATNYFQLMYILAKFVPADVKDLLRKITQQVSNVERLRGVGFDINLRSQLEKLENIVKGAK